MLNVRKLADLVTFEIDVFALKSETKKIPSLFYNYFANSSCIFQQQTRCGSNLFIEVLYYKNKTLLSV